MKLKLVICLFTLISLSSTEASYKKINKLKDKISNETNRINKLAAQIQDIDSKISANNETYVERMKELESMEQKVENLRTDLNNSADFISKEYQATKKAFNHFLLESLDHDSDDSLKSKTIYQDLLKKKLTELKKAQENSKNLLTLINSYDQTITDKKSSEETLYKLIMDLENNKKTMSQKYISLMEKKNRDQATLDKLVAKRKALKKVRPKRVKKSSTPFKVGLPLDNFINASKGKNGISFKFSETTPIKAPRSGKIVYAGQLASYGNVLIIDHGQDVRSVLLGDIVAKVKKGDTVVNNQIIGYTVSDLGNVKGLYFEVRKKDVAQNTVNWISNNKKLKLKL